MVEDQRSDLIGEVIAAERCGVTRQALSKWRRERRGPPFLKIEGAIRYSRRELEAWLAERTVHPGATRTAEVRP